MPCPGDGLALVPTENHLGLLYKGWERNNEILKNMAKNNRPALILTFFVVLGLFSLTGAVVWLGLKMQSNDPAASVAPVSSASAPSAEIPQQSGDVAQQLNQVPLESDRGVDYRKLRENLLQKNWRGADRETYERLLDAAGPKAQAVGMTPQAEMDLLPCKDLQTVDRLWSSASNGLFGFTAQQGVLRALGDYRKMYDEVGWQSRSGEWAIEWTYNPQIKRMDYKPGKEPNFTKPPAGHFPTVERGYNFDSSLDGALKRCKF
ncbi:GUN4 domain-containing protein [Microcoleus sp. A006_D1]|uniref:GUN4 domain-containing protein n=1 Tax=Microcoleus sp. A006_D1 TaxID=3055267 RepID=UPI002FD101B3